MALKADALAVTTYQAHKQLLEAIGNGDKVLADSDGKVLDGEQTRNDLTKTLDSVKNVFNDKQSVFKIFSDAKAELNAKVKAVNDAVPAKAQADAQAAQDIARPGGGLSLMLVTGGGYSAPAHQGGNGYRTFFHNFSSNYRSPFGGGNTSGSSGGGKGDNVGHPTRRGTLDGTPATNHWDGNQNITEMEF